MRDVFESQLKTLKDDMIEMGSMIEKAIENAIRALNNRDTELARAAIEADSEIDEQEKKIESLCLKLLLHQQPVASDLRMVSSALKMITDMERIGDHAADISEITICLAKNDKNVDLKVLHEMAKETTVMLVGSIDAYVNKDLDRAQEVLEHDDIVDSLFLEAKKEVIQLIRKEEDHGEEAADLLMIAKYFERIGDHAVNISEWVVFSITGKHDKNY